MFDVFICHTPYPAIINILGDDVTYQRRPMYLNPEFHNVLPEDRNQRSVDRCQMKDLGIRKWEGGIRNIKAEGSAHIA